MIERHKIGLKTIIEDRKNNELYENFIDEMIRDLGLEKYEAHVKKGEAII